LKLVLLGEGTGEPAAGIDLVPALLGEGPCIYLVGVRRSTEGLDALASANVRIVTNMPGRGLARFLDRLAYRRLSSFGMQRSFAGGCIVPDATVVVATPPDNDGFRHLGTVNGHLQAALDHSRHIIVEEDPALPRIAGSARIAPGRATVVTAHRPLPYQALSRVPDSSDFRIAEHVASLIGPGVTLQLGVGGAIECLGKALRPGNDLRIMTGAVGASIRELDLSGKLASGATIAGSALVGDEEVLAWARDNSRLRLFGSDLIHNPRWLARTPQLWSINVGISVDHAGNIDSEHAGGRLVSGRGGAPNFAVGAHHSPGGAVVAIIRGDRPASLVEHISRPTISGRLVDFVVSENGVADLRNTAPGLRQRRLEKILG
jgi:acyl-CoA hydrolase